MVNKAEARQAGQRARSALTPAERAAASAHIVVACQNQLDWPSYRRVSLFRPWQQRGEVDLRVLEAWLAHTWPETRVRVEPLAPFQDDGSRFDLILVPLLAFDDAGQRVGYGRGYYDRFLATQPQAQPVGVAFAAQYLTERIAAEPHDQPLPLIITEIIEVSGGSARLAPR